MAGYTSARYAHAVLSLLTLVHIYDLGEDVLYTESYFSTIKSLENVMVVTKSHAYCMSGGYFAFMDQITLNDGDSARLMSSLCS